MIAKFRAWDKHEQKMFANNELIIWNSNIYANDSKKLTCNNLKGWSIDDECLMQSTGLRDELGKELFEGDIILWTYWDGFEDSGSAKIVFDKGMFKLLDLRTEKEVWNNLFDCIENCNVYLEGNIYENKELLDA
nr:MAG TPA: YopX protein [Caudoviricetes sp.]